MMIGNPARIKSDMIDMTQHDEESHFMHEPTGLGNDDSLDLTLREALCGLLFLGIPGSIHWGALKDPEKRQYDVRYDQEQHEALDGPYNALAGRDAQEQQKYRHLDGHQGEESLNPFAIAVFLELLNLMIVKVILMPSESVMDFWKVQTSTYNGTKLRLGQHMYLIYQEESVVLRPGLWSSHPNERTLLRRVEYTFAVPRIYMIRSKHQRSFQRSALSCFDFHLGVAIVEHSCCLYLDTLWI